MRPGKMHRNGHGQCWVCERLVDRSKGGKEARKRAGWRFSVAIQGWICPTERWADRLDTGPKTPPTPETAVSPPNVENSRRFGPQALGDSRTKKEAGERVANLAPMALISIDIPREPRGRRRNRAARERKRLRRDYQRRRTPL